MDNPKGSFKTRGGVWYIACWDAKSIKNGCFCGQLLDKFKKEGEQRGDTDS